MIAKTVLTFIFRHAWLLFIIGQCVNGGVWWYRGRSRIRENPELEAGYRRLIRGWLIYGNIPWVVMGAGILFGGVPSVFHYINPRNGPFVALFYVSVVAIWVATFRWLFFQQGAEKMVQHPGLLNLPLNEPWVIKGYFLVCVAGGIIGLLVTLVGNFQVPWAAFASM